MPDLQILKELLAAKDDFVSGTLLAERVGLSRVSIRSHLEKMQEQGFAFEAIRSRGYRLTQLPREPNQLLIQAQLPRPAQALDIIVLEEIDSTNTEAERLLAHNQSDPFLVIAKKQTKGRGRLGRAWHSPSNGNLYGSFAFRPRISPARLSAFTLWMGLNICECINAFCRIEAKIKWPNDLHIQGKKVAGILTEARMDADQTRELVLGLGLNINSDYAHWPKELQAIATSLSQSKGQTFDLNRLTAAICGRVMLAYKKFAADEHRAELREKWPQYDALYNREISLMQGNTRLVGTAKGIDAQGALLLERPDGSRFQVRAGEVTIEK